MTCGFLRQLRAALTYDHHAVARDLPHLIGFLMATGLRISEACGLTWDAVDLDTGTIEVRTAAVRVRGQGLLLKSAVHRTSVNPAPGGATGPVPGPGRDRRLPQRCSHRR